MSDTVAPTVCVFSSPYNPMRRLKEVKERPDKEMYVNQGKVKAGKQQLA